MNLMAPHINSGKCKYHCRMCFAEYIDEKNTIFYQNANQELLSLSRKVLLNNPHIKDDYSLKRIYKYNEQTKEKTEYVLVNDSNMIRHMISSNIDSYTEMEKVKLTNPEAELGIYKLSN